MTIEKLPSDLWRTIYDIQGEAQQAAEGNRPCRSIEDTWARLEKVLPKPYRAAPDLVKTLIRVRGALDAMADEGIVAKGTYEYVNNAIARATP